MYFYLFPRYKEDFFEYATIPHWEYIQRKPNGRLGSSPWPSGNKPASLQCQWISPAKLELPSRPKCNKKPPVLVSIEAKWGICTATSTWV